MDNRSISLVALGLLIGVTIVGSVIGMTYFITRPLAAQIEDLESRIEALTSRPGISLERIDELERQLDAMKAQIDGLQSQLNIMNRRMEGLTEIEKLELTTCYTTANSTAGNYTVYITVKNSGSTDATLEMLFINRKPYDTGFPALTGSQAINVTAGWDTTVAPGTTLSFRIGLPYNVAPFTPGTTVYISLMSATGREYPKTLTLP